MPSLPAELIKAKHSEKYHRALLCYPADCLPGWKQSSYCSSILSVKFSGNFSHMRTLMTGDC